jgi:hypothetical protein
MLAERASMNKNIKYLFPKRPRILSSGVGTNFFFFSELSSSSVGDRVVLSYFCFKITPLYFYIC